MGSHRRKKVVMANKTNQKVNRKKPAGSTLKEKRAAKKAKAKNAAKSAPFLPPTGH